MAAYQLGFLGPPGTFTEVALSCDHRREQAPDGRSAGRFLPFASMQDTIEAVASGEVDCSIVPIENSIEGSVSATVDILAHEIDNLQIVREVRIPVRHQLLARPGVTLDQVTKVVSHPHANAQCRIWLQQQPAGARDRGGQLHRQCCGAGGQERPAVGGHRQPAGRKDLRMRGPCAPDIEDHKDNETRFVFLARQRERQDWFEPYKTSTASARSSRTSPGALLLILQEFAFRRINLTKIESRPSKRRLGDYIFLVDMEGKVDDGPVADALRCLCCKLPRLTVLGSYPVGMPLRAAGK